jgi:spore coat protein CotH
MPLPRTPRSRFFCRGLGVAAALCALGLVVAGCGPLATAETTQTTVGQSSTAQATRTTQSTTVSASSTATSSSTTTSSLGIASSSEAGAELFDSSTIHEIMVSYGQADYDAMIDTYKTSGVKDWIDATVTIDGVTYQNVGMRLKGNSSIRGLREGGSGGGPAGGPGGDSSADEPEGLPWLIRLDRNVEGQNHDGIVDLVVRSNTTETSLNEAVSLELLRQAGLASQRAIAVKFSVNGSDAVLRLATELPDDQWMAENLDSSGALYKAESTGDYSYRGDDPTSYEDVFDQEAGKDNADLTPLIEFLDFINRADDATFNAELPDRLDIESFATYLAMEQLIGNFDDIDGPGNNSYLYYEPGTGMFTVVPWDHNLAFGGFGGGQGGGRNGGQAANAQAANAQAANGQGNPAGQGAARNMGGRGRSNILVERFHANPEFEALYQEKLAELSTKLYESGAAADILDNWVTLLKTHASDLVGSSIVDQEAAKISAYFTGQ